MEVLLALDEANASTGMPEAESGEEEHQNPDRDSACCTAQLPTLSLPFARRAGAAVAAGAGRGFRGTRNVLAKETTWEDDEPEAEDEGIEGMGDLRAESPGPLDNYLKFDSLRAALVGGDTALIRGSWLVGFFSHGYGVLPCRQELPPEAFFSPEDALKAPIVAISYCWLTPEHPDPRCQQLRVIASVIDHWNRSYPDKDLAVFIDWCSLYQEPRSPEHQERYERSLDNISLWYAHVDTHVWLMTRVPDGVRPYRDRGWPTFERALSHLITPREKVLDLGLITTRGPDWEHLVKVCTTPSLAGAPMRPGPAATAMAMAASSLRRPLLPRQPVPLLPDILIEELRRKHFTSVSDRAFLERAYRRTFEDVMSHRRRLGYCAESWGDGEAGLLSDILPHCDRLEDLDLPRNLFGDVGASKLASAISCCARLKRIGLAHNRIADKGAAELAEVLPCCLRLRHLDLAHNLIGDHGAQALAGQVPHCPQLMELDLSGNDIGEEGAEKLAEAIPYCKRLERLHLFENQISNSGAERLAAVLPQCRGLQELHLGRNEIGDTGAQKLAMALPSSQLLKLELGGNEIGDSGAEELADAIPRCGRLRRLDLARNQIGDVGAGRLAAAIPHCRGLQELGLGGNEIGEILGGSRISDGGAEQVAQAIQSCGHLQKLDLSENRIGNGGAAKLAAAIQSCGSLKELDLRGNQISDGGAEELVLAIPRCGRLKKLSLWGNRIGSGGKKQLREAWAAAGKPEQQLGF